MRREKRKMKRELAVMAGSFDPITSGHLEVIRRAAALFARVTVLIARNPDKDYLFTEDERMRIARAAVAPFDNVGVEVWDGFVGEYAARENAVLVRGIRGTSDVLFEQESADFNASVYGAETVLFFADPAHAAINSTRVRECLRAGKDPGADMPKEAAVLARQILADTAK